LNAVRYLWAAFFVCENARFSGESPTSTTHPGYLCATFLAEQSKLANSRVANYNGSLSNAVLGQRGGLADFS
jgi:hypothetical protein